MRIFTTCHTTNPYMYVRTYICMKRVQGYIVAMCVCVYLFFGMCACHSDNFYTSHNNILEPPPPLCVRVCIRESYKRRIHVVFFYTLYNFFVHMSLGYIALIFIKKKIIWRCGVLIFGVYTELLEYNMQSFHTYDRADVLWQDMILCICASREKSDFVYLMNIVCLYILRRRVAA